MAIFSKILVPVDGSPPSDGALKLALALAKDQGATLTAVHVVETNRIVATMGTGSYGVDPTPVIKALRSAGESILSVAQERAQAENVPATGELFEGDSVMLILDRCKSAGSELIVMGSHGRSGIARMLFGSVAEGVLRQSTVPVLVVRG